MHFCKKHSKAKCKSIQSVCDAQNYFIVQYIAKIGRRKGVDIVCSSEVSVQG